MTATAKPARLNEPVNGAFVMQAAVVAFTVQDAGMKWLLQSHALPELLAIRSGIVLVIATAVLAARRELRSTLVLSRPPDLGRVRLLLHSAKPYAAGRRGRDLLRGAVDPGRAFLVVAWRGRGVASHLGHRRWLRGDGRNDRFRRRRLRLADLGRRWVRRVLRRSHGLEPGTRFTRHIHPTRSSDERRFLRRRRRGYVSRLANSNRLRDGLARGDSAAVFWRSRRARGCLSVAAGRRGGAAGLHRAAAGRRAGRGDLGDWPT